ncbi:hypothetical protein AKO1_010475 [Acrasis kona]|uniref:Trafficking protein particle complex subunit 13 C-terminal domain-containing protein n=1 Tax=Acrasis kona TaxID=1008807 RepID=A0AAW2ZJ29_9EUKA
MTVYTRYSENEGKIENLLPHIVDFDITLLHAQKKSSKDNVALRKNVESRRTQVFRGESVLSRVRVKPNNLTEHEQLINFGNVFNIPQVVTAKAVQTQEEKLNQIAELRKECLKVWKNLFSKLYIYSYLSRTLPNPVKPSPSSFGSPKLEREDSIVELKKFEGDEIDCYIFKSADVTKQTANSQSIYTLRSPLPFTEDDQDLTYEVEIEIEDEANEGNQHLVVDVFISSEQFSHTIVRTLADITPQQTDSIVPLELNLLLPYATSQHYLPTKPLMVLDVLSISSFSRMINMKNYVQISVENLHEEHHVTIEDVDLHLVGSTLVKYLSPQEAQSTLVSKNHYGQKPQEQSNLPNENVEASHKMKKDSCIAVHELFQSFVDKKCLPITLKPFEIFTLTHVVTPSNTNYSIDHLMSNKPEILSTSSKKPVTTLAKRKVSYFRSATNNPQNMVRDDSLCEYNSSATVKYKLQGETEIQMMGRLQARWVAVLRRGLFASIKSNVMHVKRLEPFFVSVFVTNLSDKDCDLVLTKTVEPNDVLLCQDQQVEMGVVAPQDARKVNLRFIGVQEGVSTVCDLYCYNKKTKQNMMFPFSCQVIVTE